MKISETGFENPHLIEPALKRIAELAKERGFAANSLKKLEQHIASAFEKGVADPDMALISLERLFSETSRDLSWLLEKNRLETCLKFFGYCEFLGQQALKNPEQIRTALEGIEQGESSRENIFGALEQNISGADSFEALSRGLREFKSEQYLRLGLANLVVDDRLEAELREVSVIAEAALSLGLKGLLELAQAKKLPGLSDFKNTASICVLGMGKLGSNELNFSSDIDLIYLCPDLQSLSSAADSEAELRKYSQIGELLTKLMSEITELGFIFRTDLRLRPGGENGPLVNPCDSALDYYLNFGRNWERAAFLRARPLAGDIALGEKFLSELQGFVFRRLHDFASFEDLKGLKIQIDQEARKQAGLDGFAGYDLKLGPGGIREIEFFVQALQLIYGGKHQEIRIPNTMKALSALNKLELVKGQDAEILSRAWHFLRRVEHRIQLKALRQDHRIPKNNRGQTVLARSFGFTAADGREKFLAELEKVSSSVAEIFSGLFGEEKEAAPKPARFEKLLAQNAEPEDLEPEFEQMGFSDPDLAAESWLRILSPLQRADRAPKLLAEILPILLEEIIVSSEPDLAIRQLERFLSKTNASAGYLSLLKDHPGLRKLLLDLFSGSEFLGNLLINFPELLDELVSPSALRERNASELESELEKNLSATGDYEEKLARLRRFQKMELLRIGTDELAGRMGARVLEERLSLLAGIILEQAYKASWDELVKIFGKPMADEQGERAGLLILGLGKLGSREMGWASDLDLIFIYQGSGRTDGAKSIDVHEFFVRLSQKFIATLQSQTGQGFLYKIDTRLRPSGTHGPLVVSVEGFESYHKSEAQVWEKQSLIKARPLVDGAGIRASVIKQVSKSIYSGNQESFLKEEMKKLLLRVKSELARENENVYDIKFGYGGEMELEYIVQYLQLVHAEHRPDLRVGNTWRALEQLKELEIITGPEYDILTDALWFFRRVSSRLRIYQDRPEHQIRIEPSVLDRLVKKIDVEGMSSGDQLREKLDHSRQGVHKIFMKYIGD